MCADMIRHKLSNIMKKIFAVLLAVLVVSLAQAQTDYAKEVENWRQERETNLKKETGWLTVAGLSWLKEGTNTVGAGENFYVRLTENFKQGKFGETEVKDGRAVVKVANGVEAQADGKPIAAPVDLVSDEKGK